MRIPLVMLASVALVAGACGGDDQSTDQDPVTDAVEETGAAGDDGGDEADLDELKASAEEAASSFNTGDGGGTVTVNGVTYTFESQVCFVQQPEVSIEGPASADDGSTAWVTISRSVMDRDQALELMDEQVVDMMFGESDTFDEASIAVSIGQTDMFGAGATDTDPSWSADNGVVVDLGASLTVEVTDNAITGRGEAIDSNGVAVEWGETVPIEFQAHCG